MDSRNTSVTAQPVARPFWGLWGGLSAHVSRRVDVQCHTTVLTLPDPLRSNHKMSFTCFRPRRTRIQTFPVGRTGTQNTCVHSVLWMPASCLPPRSSHAPCLSRDSLPVHCVEFSDPSSPRGCVPAVAGRGASHPPLQSQGQASRLTRFPQTGKTICARHVVSRM